MRIRTLFLLLSLAWTSQALAAADGMRSPDLPSSSASEFKYESAFSDYKPYVEEDVASWRELNEKVGGGGHAGHSMGNMKHDMGGDKMKSMTPGDKPTPMDGMEHGSMDRSPSDAMPAENKEQGSKSEHQHHPMK